MQNDQRILIVGATSAIAMEIARIYASRGASLFLVARDEAKLESLRKDLDVRGASAIRSVVMDINDTADHAAVVKCAAEFLGAVDVALIAHGVLGNSAAWQDPKEVAGILRTNFLSAALFMLPLTEVMMPRKSGCIAVISSVAGDRGRGSNLAYSSSKAGLDAFLSGLRNRLSDSGVSVLTIKPGFVDTPMIAHLKKNPLFASPEAVAKSICTAIALRRDVIYVPAFWRVIMAVVRLIPETVFKRMKL